MTVSGKDKRGLVEELRMLRTRLDRLERRNAELMQVEQELRESLEQFKIIFDDSLVGLYRTTPDGRILIANSALVNMLGYSSFSDLARRNLENEGYEPQYPRSQFRERIEHEGKVIGMESAWKKTDGTTLYVRESAQAVRDESGKTLYYEGTVEDITEYRQTKDALLASEEMFGALVRNLSEGVDIVDENLRCLFANPAGEEIFGVKPGGLVGRNLYEFISDESHAIVEELLNKRREGIASSYDLEIIRPDGQKRQLIVTGTPRFSGDGKYIGGMGLFFDVTEKKQAEDALRKAHDELEMRVQERTAELQQANEALRQSENRYRTVIENAGEGIVVVQDGKLRFVNSRHTFVTGRSQEESMSRPFMEFIHPDDQQRVAEVHAARLRGEQVPSVYEFRIIDKDGWTRWLENNGVVIEWNGKPASLNFLRNVTERKNAEEALREREEMIRALVETSRDWIWSIDVNGVHTYCNPAVEQILGYSAGELVGKLSLHLIHDDDRRMIEANLPTWIAEKRGWSNLMLRWRHKDGTYRYLESNAVPILSSEDKLVGFRGVDRDITERRQAEKTLRETTALLETIFAHTHILVAYLDPQFNFVRVNRAYAEIDGREPSGFVGRNHFELYPNAENEAIFRKVVEIGVPYFAHAKPFEYAGHPERGTTYWDWSLVPIKQQDGVVSGMILTLVNVTEQKKAEQALRESEERFRKVFEEGPIGMVLTSRDMKFFSANPAFCKMLGYTAEEMSSKTFLDVTHPAHRDADRQNVEKMWRGEVQHYMTEKRYLAKNGDVRWGSLSASLIRGRDGEPLCALAMVEDITDRKRAEDALRKSEERFRQFFENEPEYCYMVSPEGTILDVNAAALKALGRTKDELLGQPLRLIYAPESLPKITALFEKWKCGESIQNEELIILAKDGTQRTVLLSAGFVRDSGGRIMHSVSVQRDITELKQAERTLREREAALTSVFRAAPVGIGLERDRVLARVNDTICQMLGYSREEILGQHAKMFYASEEDYQRVREEKHRQILEKGTSTVETRWKRKEGRIIDVLLSTVVLDPADFSKGVTFTALDITERKAAEETLRESEEKFRSLAEQSPNMIFINKKGRIVYANRKCEEIMGYTREELYSPDFDFRTLVAPESADVIRESFTRHLQGHEVEPYEYCLISKAGERIEAINTSKLIQYEGQMAILGIVTDITERKRAEREVRESHERFRILFESAPDAIYVTDLEGRFVDGNKAAEELVGFAKAELIGKSLAESGLLSAEDLSKAAENLKKTAAGQFPEPTEYTIRRKSGSLIAVEIRTFPVRIGGKMLSLGIARDVTARKHAEEAIRASEKKFRSVFETAANLITSVNEQGIIVDCNNKVREFLGYEKEEILGRSMARIIHPDYLDKAQDALKEILTQGFSYNKEYRVVRKDGSLIDVSINSSAIEDEHGKYTRALCIIDDITERKGAQQKLLDDREQLKSLASQLSLTEERERRRLATELHDHIGQSLVFSKIKLDQMRKSGSAGELTEALKDVSGCLERVIQDTRTLTFDLSDPILYELGFEAAVAEWLTEHVQEKHGIETEFQDDGQAKPLDEDIRALLFRNVREVLINIIKHAQARHVKVAVGKADKSICVSIEDDGVGFDPVEVAATAVRKAEFGLFSIRERLEQLGGRVEIESKPGRGTKVTMIAPLKYEQVNDGTQK